MKLRRRDIAALGIATAGLAAAVRTAPAVAQPKMNDSTWELVKKNGQVRMGVFEYPPYFVRNKASGEWEGAMVEMGKDIANELKVKYVPVEVGGFAEAVLSLQAGKVEFTVVQKPYEFGRQSVTFLYKAKTEGVDKAKQELKVPADGIVDTGVEIVTPKTYPEFKKHLDDLGVTSS